MWSGNAPENVRLSGQQESANNTIYQQTLTTLNAWLYDSMMMFASVFVESEHILYHVHTWVLDGVGDLIVSPCRNIDTLAVSGICSLLGAHSQTGTKNVPSDITPVLPRRSLEHASESDTAAQKREPPEAQYFAWSRHLSFSESCECNKRSHDAEIS